MADGGRAPGPDFVPDDSHALAKPYDLTGEMTPEKVGQLDEMLTLLFESDTFNAADIATVSASAAGGDVVGPALAENNNIVLFDGVTGKLIKDSGSTIAEVSGTSGVFPVLISITEAQLEGADTTDIPLVAGVADKIIVVLQALFWIDLTVVYSNNPVWTIRYDGLATAMTSSVTPVFTSGIASKVGRFGENPANVITGPVDGVGIHLEANAALTGAGSATGKISLLYALIPAVE